MSQKKVDSYKEHKKNRKEEAKKAIQKKKMWQMIGALIVVVVVAALVAGIAVTIVNATKKDKTNNYITYFAQPDYADIQGTLEEVSEE